MNLLIVCNLYDKDLSRRYIGLGEEEEEFSKIDGWILFIFLCYRLLCCKLCYDFGRVNEGCICFYLRPLLNHQEGCPTYLGLTYYLGCVGGLLYLQ